MNIIILKICTFEHFQSPLTNKMDDIRDFFISIIKQSPGIDMAESEFKRALVDDPELKKAYRDYCREEGCSERNGFSDFCEEYYSEQDSVWDSLTDYDDE